MYADQKSDTDLINIEITQTPTFHQIQILNSLRTNLSEFTFMYRNTPKPEFISENEDYFTKQIGRFLTSKNNGYLFEPEAKCGPDLQVIIFKTFNLHDIPIFVIEAKRLRKSNGRDYVQGKTGGIERFKKEKHGKQHNISAMLGYVQENNFDHWFNKINEWIDDLIADTTIYPRWVIYDKLRKSKTSYPSEYESIHIRKTKEPIKLHHFWLDFSHN